MTEDAQAARDRLLTLEDDRLLQACRTDTFRGSGRGGQKRNTTESAVRLTHEPTGVSVTCDDTRSQRKNRERAVRQMRRELAYQIRCDPPATWPFDQPPGKRTADYAAWLARLLDVLEAYDYRVADAAAFCGTSTGQLVKHLADDQRLWQEVNRQRQTRGMKTLRAK